MLDEHLFEVYKTIDLGGGYKWAFRINRKWVVLSRTKKEAQTKSADFVAMSPKKREDAWLKIPHIEKDG
jgi:hypothetical protein